MMKKLWPFMVAIGLVITTINFTSVYSLADLPQKNYLREERQLILDLYDIGIIKLNDTSLVKYKQAADTDPSPHYIDCRHIISFPDIHNRVVALMAKKAATLSFDAICGVPFAALAAASVLANEIQRPLIMRRPYRKQYGTCKKIEGIVNPGMRCILIDDVITTGNSMLETIEDLETEKLVVKDCIVLFDRQQGGPIRYKKLGYTVHSLFTTTDFMTVLQEAGKLDSKTAQLVIDWTLRNQLFS